MRGTMARVSKKTTKTETTVDTTNVVTDVQAETKEKTKKTTRTAKAKTTTAKTEAVKTPARKTTAKAEEVKKAEVNVSITLQFHGKSYTKEDLMRIAKDVWKFDLNQKEEDLTSVELYVKPEDGLCYYVMNGTITGSFGI